VSSVSLAGGEIKLVLEGNAKPIDPGDIVRVTS
jgi:hypothetical protein